MTSAEATALAVRISQCFTGPPVDVWEEDLANLDAGRAGTALARLRRDHDQRWLSVAAFLAMYRSIHTDDASTVEKCGWCDASGWVQVDDLVINAGTDREYRDSQVVPCSHCSHGKQAERSTVWTKRGQP